MREAYTVAKRRFRERYGVDSFPELSVQDGDELGIDRDRYVLLFGEDINETREEPAVQTLYTALEFVYADALKQVGWEEARELRERYAQFDPEIQYEEIAFAEMDEAGCFTGEDRVLVSTDYMGDVCPETLETGGGLRGVLRHELTHALRKTIRPNIRQYRDDARNPELEHREDRINAVEEGMACFEGSRGEDPNLRGLAAEVGMPDQEFSDPWSIPSALMYYSDMRPGETLPFENAYSLGYFTAELIVSAFEEERGTETAEEFTREFFLTATTPEMLEGAIDQVFDMRGLPNYIDDLKHYDTVFATSGEERLVEESERMYQELGTAQEDELIEPFYRGSALVHAYFWNTGVPPIEMPGPAKTLWDRLNSIGTEKRLEYVGKTPERDGLP